MKYIKQSVKSLVFSRDYQQQLYNDLGGIKLNAAELRE